MSIPGPGAMISNWYAFREAHAAQQQQCGTVAIAVLSVRTLHSLFTHRLLAG
ncbi:MULTISPECIES: hypothetical protein [unclassified Cupriavidus]|uniref:hypothetical protein n=1 Tax=unclassified Cupriavidus TaxID=2640874 RepID=UPI00040A2E4E|nr:MULTISPECIES: hypothetical protein [unclassified Cupriavidus]